MTPIEAPALAFVDDLDAPVLSADDAHHLLRVLRLRPGTGCTVSDGAGRWREVRLGPDGVLEPVGPIVVAPPPDRPPVTIGFALVKGDRPELVVQKLTELGVDRIVPFTAERSVVRWAGDRVVHHHQRLCRVAREAAMQSRRVRLPEILPPCAFAEAAAIPGAVLADPGGAPLSGAHSVVLIGPEGGWSDQERAHGCPTVTLGEGILRAETAAITAAVLLTRGRSTHRDAHDP